jgi:hypothetical protein
MTLQADALYTLLPAYHRRRDAEQGFPLRELFRVFQSEGAEVVDADLDQYADALFVETCAEILLPRIGALVGAETLRPMPAESGLSTRAFIGNLLRYRRAKGTAAALEMLARDVTGYSAKAVEYFQHLSVTQTLRAPRPDRPGTATMRDPDGRPRHGGAFDRNPRTPDMRSIARAGGRYNIPNVGIHLWRLDAVPYAAPKDLVGDRLAAVPQALPWGAHPGHFAMLPDGRAAPMFQTAHNDEHASPDETQVPARLRRLPLWRELESWREAIARGTGASFVRRWFAEGREPFTLFVLRDGPGQVFTRVPSEQVMIGALVPDAAVPTPPWTRPSPKKTYKKSPTQNIDLDVAVVVDPATGRMVFAAAAAGQTDVIEVRVAHALGSPGPLGGGAYDRNDFESKFDVAADSPVYLVGSGQPVPGTTPFADLGSALSSWSANGAAKTGYIVVTGNVVDKTDTAQPDLEFAMPANSTLTIVAAEWRAPNDTAAGVAGFIIRRSRRLMLLRPLVIKSAGPAAGTARKLILDGVYAHQGFKVETDALHELEVRHSTLLQTTGTALDLHGTVAAPLSASLFRTVTGRIAADADVGLLRLRDCIVARHATQPAIEARAAEVNLVRATVFGSLAAKVIDASDCILLDLAEAERRQEGCMRYSYIGDSTAKLPRRYRCQPEMALSAQAEALGRGLTSPEEDAVRLSVRPIFVDIEPGEPAYAQLAIDAPPAIALGGEGETEMGAWAFLGGSTRLANINDLIGNYMPFGLEGGVLRSDQSSAEARGRNVP